MNFSKISKVKPSVEENNANQRTPERRNSTVLIPPVNVNPTDQVDPQNATYELVSERILFPVTKANLTPSSR